MTIQECKARGQQESVNPLHLSSPSGLSFPSLNHRISVFLLLSCPNNLPINWALLDAKGKEGGLGGCTLGGRCQSATKTGDLDLRQESKSSWHPNKLWYEWPSPDRLPGSLVHPSRAIRGRVPRHRLWSWPFFLSPNRSVSESSRLTSVCQASLRQPGPNCTHFGSIVSCCFLWG